MSDRGRQLVAAVLVPIAVVGGLTVVRELRDDDRSGVQVTPAPAGTEFEHDYRIPAGTADRIASGETVQIVPRELEVRVGESIRIVNDDDEGHVVGVFFVGAGEVAEQTFTAAGELSGDCTVHPSGAFTLRVEA